jgi:hypothetical protein
MSRFFCNQLWSHRAWTTSMTTWDGLSPSSSRTEPLRIRCALAAVRSRPPARKLRELSGDERVRFSIQVTLDLRRHNHATLGDSEDCNPFCRTRSYWARRTPGSTRSRNIATSLATYSAARFLRTACPSEPSSRQRVRSYGSMQRARCQGSYCAQTVGQEWRWNIVEAKCEARPLGNSK